MYPQNAADMNVDCHVLEVLEAWKAGCDGSKRWCFWEIDALGRADWLANHFNLLQTSSKMERWNCSRNLAGFTASNTLFGGRSLYKVAQPWHIHERTYDCGLTSPILQSPLTMPLVLKFGMSLSRMEVLCWPSMIQDPGC